MGKRRRERIDFEAFDEENANGILEEKNSKDVIYLSDDWPRAISFFFNKRIDIMNEQAIAFYLQVSRF